MIHQRSHIESTSARGCVALTLMSAPSIITLRPILTLIVTLPLHIVSLDPNPTLVSTL